MTALDQYDRLEAAGLYTPGQDAQRLDVILSIGNATLTITDHRDVALAHWSLAAIERLNPGQRPALYAPGLEAPERIETGDEAIIRAIEKVRTAVDRTRPHPGRLRSRITWGAGLGLLALSLLWLPDAIVHTAARIVPEAARATIGSDLHAEITRRTGGPCSSGTGQAALDALVKTLSPHGPNKAHVLPSGATGPVHLPGGQVLLSRNFVEDHETPLVTAGALLAEADRAQQTDPLIPLLKHLGVGATVRLMTSGSLPDAGLGSYAETLLTAPPVPVAQDKLAARFLAAGLPTAPYAHALDITGETTLKLIEADVSPSVSVAPISDGEWVALQSICID